MSGRHVTREIISMSTKSIPLWIIRVVALLLLIVGIVVWPGNADALIAPHVVLGVVLTLTLFVLEYQAFRAGVSPALVALAVVWSMALPIMGLAQGMLPDSLAMAAQVFHLLVGVGAWVLAEILVRRMPKKAR
jgi:hypothetical protein